MHDESHESEDVDKVASKLPGMNRGPVAKLWEDVRALWAVVKDPTATRKSKAIAIGALVYLVSPPDTIPDGDIARSCG
jgi:uncharacterized membrane protein YkvA (DUF1232 family)